jgi:hypothetical protein
MADHFEFRFKDTSDKTETHGTVDMADIVISTYNTGGGSTASKPTPEFQFEDSSPEFIDDFLF